MPRLPPRTLKLGLVQAKAGDDPDKNLAHQIEMVRSAARAGANVVCLQELFRSSYFCQTHDASNFDLAEPIPGPTTQRMSALARELGVVLVVPVFEKRAAGLYHNSAAVVDADGSMMGVYRKMHIPHDPNFYEKYYFAPGDLGFRAFDTRFGRVGVLICWDQWYPEAARLTALQGAELLLYPTAIGNSDADEGEAGRQRESWELAQRAHALANGVFVAAVNRVGREDALTFWGGSFVADPFGHVVDRAPVGKEHVLVTTLDLSLVEKVRQNWPFLRDRRVDAYGGITSRFLDDE